MLKLQVDMASGDNSKLRLITFLGTGRYERVEYIWGDIEGSSSERFTTEFFPEAIIHFLGRNNVNVDEVLVLVTNQAKEQNNFKELQKRLGAKLRAIDIPFGQKESELWEIFDRIASEVREKEEIVLDITHGFRSIPMIVFSVADYLKKTKSVTIRHILYGAYEAGKHSQSNTKRVWHAHICFAAKHWKHSQSNTKRVPIFDLTPLLDLMEWTGGLEAFLKRGEADLVGEKMQKKQASLHRQRTFSSNPPYNLQSVGEKLQTLSRSLHLARPREVLKDAHDLLELLEKAKSELEEWAKPFATIIDRVHKELEAFAYKDANDLTPESLEKQLALLEYYINKDLMIPAVLLAREWMVSYVIYRHYGKCTDWNKKEKREEAENHLNRNKSLPAADSSGNMLPDDLLDCWKSLADLRNDLAHCGMRENPRPAKNIKSELENIVRKLRGINIGYEEAGGQGAL